MKLKHCILLILMAFVISSNAKDKPLRERYETLLEEGWRFSKGEQNASAPEYDDSKWQEVVVPHDWAIYGPFGRDNDAQVVAIKQNLETRAALNLGRTGGLPYVGVGWYRIRFDIDRFDTGKSVSLLFDGAMSEARVYVNGKEACFWPFGYNSFHCDITPFLNIDGKDNVLAVRLENMPESSRWYPGAGLYRNVHLIVTDKIHIPVWGTKLTTPYVSEKESKVILKTEVIGNTRGVSVKTVVFDKNNNKVSESREFTQAENTFEQKITIRYPDLWTPETPDLYTAVTTVYFRKKAVDTYTTRFGIRSIRLKANDGFYLNGSRRKIQGVCNHHDLGPLGSAVNKAAIRRQLTILKDMGCDAIRTAHNMPAPELVELCDEMGFMLILEPFDEWDVAKCKNGYHRYFIDWAEKDMVNMIRNYRNHPSVIMWSLGNEVPSQCLAEGYDVAKYLRDICLKEDSTRLITCGMDQVLCVLENGLATLLDVPGFNYRVHLYEQAYNTLPQKLVLGTETASTVSSRGIYKFPVIKTSRGIYEDQQCSSYDLEYCGWSNIPDDDFAMAEDHDWTIGQFVWTGFDYLGEPTPYGRSWPNHSSMFGIVDLASIPKDRYYLYRSIWNKNEATLHILPHWNWEGREGEITPVFVYTSYPSAELFINGKSYGRQIKNDSTNQNRFRLMWYDVVYEPGELKVVAYDEDNKPVAEKITRTSGKPHHIELIPDRRVLTADGKDLSYVNVRIVDKDGNLCPADSTMINFTVRGAGRYRAGANGDPTCLDLFHIPVMHAFSGQLTAIIQADKSPGIITLTANAEGLERAEIEIIAE